MLNKLFQSFLPEITAVEVRLGHSLRKLEGQVVHKGIDIKKENRLWLPVMCLLSARMVGKKVTDKILHLAGIFYLLNCAFYLHWRLPDDGEAARIKEEVHYPLLVGDWLYSNMYADICRYDLQQYLQPLSSLMVAVKQELALNGLKKKENIPTLGHELKAGGLMTEQACSLGIHVAADLYPLAAYSSNTDLPDKYLMDTMGSLGYRLGVLKILWEKKENPASAIDDWHHCWDIMGRIPSGREKLLLEELLLSMGGKWGLYKPAFCKENHA